MKIKGINNFGSLRIMDSRSLNLEADTSTNGEYQSSLGPPSIVQSNKNLNLSESSRNDNPPESLESPSGFEEILETLGCFGPFQLLVLCSYSLMEVAAAFVVFIPIFDIGITNNDLHNCTEKAFDDGLSNTTTDSAIQETSFMEGFSQIMESPFQFKSIVDEWDLRCDRAWIPDLFTSCMMAGMVIGNLVTCQIADWYGRRKCYLLVVFLMFSGTILSAFSPTIYFYAVARFISGVGFCGFMNVSSMAVMEFMTPKWRSLSNCVGPMGEGIMLLSLLAYFIRPWRQLYLATLVPYIFIIPIYAFLPESPRWLLRNRRVKEAHDVLGYMAKINGKEPISFDVLEALRKREELESESLKAKKLSYMEFIRNRQLSIAAFYLFAIWFSWNVSYYGISYNIRNVQGNPYFNVVLLGLANSIGQRSSMPISDSFGRRKAVLYAMTTSAVVLVAVAVCFLTIKVSSNLILIACFIGLLGMACTRASARLLSGETFPTAVRTMGLGVGGLGANLAGLVTPQVAYIGSTWPSFPFFIFAAFSVLGAIVVFMMKETNGAPLTDEVKKTNKKCISVVA